MSHPLGAENSVRSCDQPILVHAAAEAIPSDRPNRRGGGRGSAASWRVLMAWSVWTVNDVVLGVLLQDKSEVACSGDQEVVEAFAA
jgi:hypothetical protein